jgi:hypothetical protein
LMNKDKRQKPKQHIVFERYIPKDNPFKINWFAYQS